MPLICYKSKRFGVERLGVIDEANSIINEYIAKGFKLSLRQLYYQFISRDLFPEKWIDPKTKTKNTDKNYGKLGEIITDARLAGMIDWENIEDRTRELKGAGTKHRPLWDSPMDIIRGVAYSYRIDKWKDQEYRPEVWIEKDALVDVIAGICNELDVPYFSCRGYTSLSEMWVASQRLLGYVDNHQQPIIIHLGDHDPSGMDMTRDIYDRLNTFGVNHLDVERVALNYDQIEEFDPPPNPAKVKDPRSKDYVAQFGDDSWELDALEPEVMSGLIRDKILLIRDDILWENSVEQEKDEKKRLAYLRDNWDDISDKFDI